jgi:2-C-methyl-D-erythritol 2,4-cyclodiphosphate synthase
MMRRNGDSEEFIAANQFDIRDVVNVASLIEKETASNQESYRIASVIYNRLFNWGSTPRYLNIDATLIAQAPKVAPYRQAMVENLADVLGVDTEQINVKATTEEKLGFTGDGSGMAAHAVVLLEKVN